MKKLIFPLMMAALLLNGCAAKKDETTPTTQAANGDMVITLSDIGAEPTFIDGKIGDAPMQVIAIRDADGTVRLSYNTCQVCKGSPWAFFEEQNGGLVCQNCGNAFSTDAIGKGGYGCMPLMVPAYTLTDDSVVIAADTLEAVKDAFSGWKVFP